jgi:hypothetical protein
MTESDWWNSSDPLGMFLFVIDKSSDRKLRLFAAGCCRQIPALVVNDLALRELEVGERFADGLANREELARAWQRARRRDERVFMAVAVALAGDSRRGQPNCSKIDWQGALGRAIAQNVIAASSHVAGEVAGHAARDAAGGSAAGLREIRARDAGIAAGEAGHRRKCCELLRCLSNPFTPLPPPEAACRAWNDGWLGKMASAVYEEHDFSPERMGILADALEDSGCADEEALRHCRFGSVHARGCYVLDWLTSRGA